MKIATNEVIKTLIEDNGDSIRLTTSDESDRIAIQIGNRTAEFTPAMARRMAKLLRHFGNGGKLGDYNESE